MRVNVSLSVAIRLRAGGSGRKHNKRTAHHIIRGYSWADKGRNVARTVAFLLIKEAVTFPLAALEVKGAVGV